MDQLPPWTPFERGRLRPLTEAERQVRAESVARTLGGTVEQALSSLTSVDHDEIWVNSRYQVNVRRFPHDAGGADLVHLSIKRRDKAPLGPERYRDFMRIKDELVGPECEGMELYPARSRELDSATQYHVWVVNDPTFRFPIGFDCGRIVTDQADRWTGQNPFEEHQRYEPPTPTR